MHVDLIKLQTVFLGIIAVIAVGFLLQITSAFVIPFVIAVLMVVVLAPAQDWLEARRIPTWASGIVILLGLFLATFVVGVLIYDALASVTKDLPKYYAKATTIIERFDALAVEQTGISIKTELTSKSEHPLADLFSSSSVVSAINASLGTFMGFFSALMVTLLFLMFILGSRKSLAEKFEHFLADREFDEQSSRNIIHNINRQVQDYLVLKTLISLGTGLATWLVAYLVGLDFALVWGFLAFLLNYIPSIGPIVASVPPVAIAFLQFDNPWWALLVSVLLLAVQFLSGNVIEPQLMGDRLNLNIVVVLMSLFVWGLVWGFAGMVLSVPLTASINIVLANTKRFQNVSVWLSS